MIFSYYRFYFCDSLNRLLSLTSLWLLEWNSLTPRLNSLLAISVNCVVYKSRVLTELFGACCRLIS